MSLIPAEGYIIRYRYRTTARGHGELYEVIGCEPIVAWAEDGHPMVVGNKRLIRAEDSSRISRDPEWEIEEGDLDDEDCDCGAGTLVASS